jgi:xanthine dehydrogenase accessory factor
MFEDILVVIKGGGDLATGVAHRLHRAGMPVLITELAQPTVIRRAVALASAV